MTYMYGDNELVDDDMIVNPNELAINKPPSSSNLVLESYIRMPSLQWCVVEIFM